MAKQLQLRRGTTAQHSTFTGAVGEITVDTDKKTLVVHDGSTAGGIPVAKDSTAVHNSGDETVAGVKTFTGTVVLPSTTSIGTVSNTEIGYLDGVTSAIQPQLNTKAPLASPALTGTPTAPTASVNTSTTQIATTAFVNAEIANDAVPRITSTDNAIARYDGTGGAIQNSSAYVDDSGNITGNTLIAEHGPQTISLGSDGTYSGVFVTGGAFPIWVGGGERVRIDSSGNVGIGVTPSRWQTGWKTMEIGDKSFYGQGGAGDLILGHNWYQNSSGTNLYKTTGAAGLYNLTGNVHTWRIAPSGTADNAITFTQAMTLGANGNLLVGTTADNGVDKLQVNGSIRATQSNLRTGVQYGTGSTLTVTVPTNAAGTLCINAFYNGNQAHTWTLPWIYYTDSGKAVGTPLSAGNATLISSAVMNNAGQLVVTLAHSGVYLLYSLSITN